MTNNRGLRERCILTWLIYRLFLWIFVFLIPTGISNVLILGRSCGRHMLVIHRLCKNAEISHYKWLFLDYMAWLLAVVRRRGWPYIIMCLGGAPVLLSNNSSSIGWGSWMLKPISPKLSCDTSARSFCVMTFKNVYIPNLLAKTLWYFPEFCQKFENNLKIFAVASKKWLQRQRDRNWLLMKLKQTCWPLISFQKAIEIVLKTAWTKSSIL